MKKKRVENLLDRHSSGLVIVRGSRKHGPRIVGWVLSVAGLRRFLREARAAEAV